MTDLESARLQVELFDRRNLEREQAGEPLYYEPSHVTFARALIAVTAERDKLLKEHEEDQGVIRVWRGRTERAEAERDKLRAACQRVLRRASYSETDGVRDGGVEIGMSDIREIEEALKQQ